MRVIFELKRLKGQLLNSSSAEKNCLLFLVITFIFLSWLYAQKHNYIVCDMECGETLIALKAIKEFHMYGFKYGLLEVMGGTPKNPMLYTHNVNIGSLIFVLLDYIGVESMRYQIFMPLLAHSLGLIFVYYSVKEQSESRGAGLLVFCIFVLTYWGLGAFAFNPLRAWHFPAIFITSFYSILLCKRECALNRSYLGLMLGSLIAFGCGYDYWIICACISVVTIFTNFKQSKEDLIKKLLIACLIFLMPFILRQFQIIYVMGYDYWMQDLKFSIAIKVPYANKIIALPSLEAVDEWYKSKMVTRPPASPGNTVSQMFNTFIHMVERVTLPRWGYLNLITFMMLPTLLFFGFIKNIAIKKLYFSLVLPITIGALAGIILLAPFSLHVYFKHEFPLFVFPLLLTKAIFIYQLFLWGNSEIKKYFRIAAILLLILYALGMGLTHYNGSAFGKYPNYKWLSFVRAHEDKKILVTGDPNHIIESNLDRVTYALPLEVEKVLRSNEKTYYNYVIYSPIGELADFDSVAPNCEWVDWVSKFFFPSRKFDHDIDCIYGKKIPKDAYREKNIKEILNIVNNSLFDSVQSDNDGIGYLIFKNKVEVDSIK